MSNASNASLLQAIKDLNQSWERTKETWRDVDGKPMHPHKFI